MAFILHGISSCSIEVLGDFSMAIDEKIYSLTPTEIMALDVGPETPQPLIQELAYFVWNFWAEDEDLQNWRKVKLLPLIKLSPIIGGSEEEDDD